MMGDVYYVDKDGDLGCMEVDSESCESVSDQIGDHIDGDVVWYGLNLPDWFLEEVDDGE